MSFITLLEQRNPAVQHGKKGRWRIIAIEYIRANPNKTMKQIREGLGISTTGSTAWSSLSSAIRKLVEENVVLRTWEIPYKHTLK